MLTLVLTLLYDTVCCHGRTFERRNSIVTHISEFELVRDFMTVLGFYKFDKDMIKAGEKFKLRQVI